MFKFLLGVAFGAAGYWAWQSFGRDLLGMGGDETSYGGFSASGSGTSYGSSTGSTFSSPSTSAPLSSSPPTEPTTTPASTGSSSST